MDNNDAIRVNVKIHLDKDPDLHKFLDGIPKDARARRLINLAAIGLLVQNSSIAIGGAPLTSSASIDDVTNTVASKTETIDTEITPSVLKPNVPVYDEEELETIGDIFS